MEALTARKKSSFYMAYGSGMELESQIKIAQELFPQFNYVKVVDYLSETMRMLNKRNDEA